LITVIVVPNNACTSEKDEDFEYITVKGWFLIKANEYENNKNKSENDERLAELFYDFNS